MSKQFNIRSERARELAIELSKRLGKPLNQVVEEALQAYDEAQPRALTRADVFSREALEKLWAEAREKPEIFKIEDLYDSETGLPA